jgi:Big-like domain-containing protein
VINLEEGENIIDMEAMDKAGNIAFKQIVYTYTPKVSGIDTTLPTVVITSPRINESILEGKITISGWAVDNKELVSVHCRIDDGEWVAVQGTNDWSYEVELFAGLYEVEARAIDSSGNEKYDRVWANVVIESDQGSGKSGGGSSISLIIIVVIFMILLVGFVFGYLLYLRNRNLRGQLDEAKVRNEEREQMRGRSSPGRRRPVRARRPPEGRRP